jgi:hypothetical protein
VATVAMQRCMFSTGSIPRRTPTAVQFSATAARKLKLSLQRPALQQPIKEAGVKDVARVSRIHCFHLVRACKMKFLTVPGQHAFMAKRRRSQSATVTPADFRQ